MNSKKKRREEGNTRLNLTAIGGAPTSKRSFVPRPKKRVPSTTM